MFSKELQKISASSEEDKFINTILVWQYENTALTNELNKDTVCAADEWRHAQHISISDSKFNN